MLKADLSAVQKIQKKSTFDFSLNLLSVGFDFKIEFPSIIKIQMTSKSEIPVEVNDAPAGRLVKFSHTSTGIKILGLGCYIKPGVTASVSNPEYRLPGYPVFEAFFLLLEYPGIWFEFPGNSFEYTSF